VCPGSVGTRQALLQGWLLCVGFVCLAKEPDLVGWLNIILVVYVNFYLMSNNFFSVCVKKECKGK
jgi:hypothetical protein